VDRKPATNKASAETVDKVELWRSAADSWKRIKVAAETNLMRAELTVAEYRILRVLKEHGSSQRGLAERVRSKEDRREVLIAITPKGSAAYAKGEEIHTRFVEKALSGLKPGELTQLVSLLENVADASDLMIKEQGIALPE